MEERTKYKYLKKSKLTDDNKCIFCKQIIYESDKSYDFQVIKTKRSHIIVFHTNCYRKSLGRKVLIWSVID